MEWKVYFEDNPGCHRPHRGRPGQEVSCGAHSVWGGQHFIIPAIYLCGKGLVVDICRRVEREAIEAHYQKLAAYEGMDIDECPPEVVELAEAEDPFGSFDYLPSVAINGKTVEYSRGAGEYYNPLRSEEEIVCSGEQAARDIVKHYGLDPEQGWDLRQWSFPWATKRRPAHITSLTLTLTQREQPAEAVQFTAAPGKVVEFAHPVTGVPCVLTVKDLKPARLPESDLPHMGPPMEWPREFVEMTYTLTPAVTTGWVQVNDCASSDKPIRKSDAPTEDGAIGIIGGADGPTAIFVSGKQQGDTRTACSSLHFAPVEPENIRWKVTGKDKNCGEEHGSERGQGENGAYDRRDHADHRGSASGESGICHEKGGGEQRRPLYLCGGRRKNAICRCVQRGGDLKSSYIYKKNDQGSGRVGTADGISGWK